MTPDKHLGEHTGSPSHWVEAVTIALWEHTLDHHHTGLKQLQ